MKNRRKAREYALQLLYQIELSNVEKQEAEKDFWAGVEKPDAEAVAFARALVDGVLAQKQEIDEQIERLATNWRLDRMPFVDKNVLRMAVFELKNHPEIPLKVTLNEAIEIVKTFGAGESSAFINGVLDKIAVELGRK
ncbi:MAG: transcription antitermination factor NusB [Deltaproteobacteria bacterium]|nr:transcription antitermination factor NusB [Deltaproteobacteria bacterium]